MAKGKRCPLCGELKFHLDDEKAFRECANCNFIGWRLTDPVRPGPGKGYTCVVCGEYTLHSLMDVTGVDLYRCSACLYVGVKPAKNM